MRHLTSLSAATVKSSVNFRVETSGKGGARDLGGPGEIVGHDRDHG